MAINTKQEAFDFLNLYERGIVIAETVAGGVTVYYGATETVSTDKDVIKDFTAALNVAVDSFMDQDCTI